MYGLEPSGNYTRAIHREGYKEPQEYAESDNGQYAWGSLWERMRVLFLLGWEVCVMIYPFKSLLFGLL